MDVNETKKRSTALYVAGTIFCLLVAGFFLLTSGGDSLKKDSTIHGMQQMTQKVRGMETEMKKKSGDVMELADQYQKQTGASAPLALNLTDLSPEERELLEQRIGKEKDVSARSLLKEILDKTDEISELRQKIAHIEDLLPEPHIAQKGESHYAIALAFLVDQKGVEKERAQKILARTALFEELARGFKIWNFYNGDEYGTSVTQGDARVSPNAFVYRAKKKLTDARDQALSERDQLAENIKTLEARQDETVTELDEVNRENRNLMTRVGELNRRVDSVAYRLDSQKNLEKKGILKRRFLRSPKLKDVSPEHFNGSLDLNLGDYVVISAADLGVKKIKDVVLYPRFYKKGKNYKVSIAPNKKRALLTLLNTDAFKSERLIIAVK